MDKIDEKQDIQDKKLDILVQAEEERKWGDRGRQIGVANAAHLQRLEDAAAAAAAGVAPRLQHLQLPAPPPPAPVAIPTRPQPKPEEDIQAVKQFLCGLKRKVLLNDVSALWTAWSTGKFPNSIMAQVELPGGKSWRELDAAFHQKADSPVDQCYRAWAGKVQGCQGAGVSFMGNKKRRVFLEHLQKQIDDPAGPGESAVLESVQAKVDNDFSGKILDYAKNLQK